MSFIIIHYKDEKYDSVKIPFLRTADIYRAKNDMTYLRRCEFAYITSGFDELKIVFGSLRSEIIKPTLFAEDVSSEFKHLHKVTIEEYDKMEEMNGYEIVGDFEDYGIKINYADPLKPDIVFKFTNKFDWELLRRDKDEYLAVCQFWYLEDEKLIRIANPYIYFP